MRTIEAVATVDENGTILVPGHPDLSPGQHHVVLVIDDRLNPGKEQKPRSLADRQYQLAGQYPNEYVVLVGERVIHHSQDRSAAIRAYSQAFLEAYDGTPVMVDPNRTRKRRPPIRGRRRGHRGQK